jgi:hypothetical protein
MNCDGKKQDKVSDYSYYYFHFKLELFIAQPASRVKHFSLFCLSGRPYKREKPDKQGHQKKKGRGPF